jgi:hypothetical protein
MPRDFKPPFKFDVGQIVKRLRNLPVSVDGVTIALPFIEVTVKPDDTERKVAREIVIRLADRRVLNSYECCDGCIREALDSLQEIRKIIVDKEVELSGKSDGVLYVLLDSIRDAIRQFLTFEQRLRKQKGERNQLYFAGLEMLRAHIHRCLLQVSKIAEMEIPDVADYMRYDEHWKIEAYKPVPLLKEKLNTPSILPRLLRKVR